MNSLRQSCRPKHQVLILKCYPRLQKGYREEEVKPNSSELSYLLFYASSRRTKLVKVGDFLDKRTAGDVWRSRIASVLVTLQILQALIEKCPKDIPLYANSVLSVLRTVLRSNDVTMVEASVPMFEAFCEHQDPAALAADNEYLTQYEEIVQLYAQFANKEDQPAPAGAPLSWPVAIKFRKAGLHAIKAVAASESLGAGKQLDAIIPVILVNLYADNGAYLHRLEILDREKEHHDKEAAIARRKSTSTVPGESEGDPLAASGTTEDADKIAEEEAGVIALQALRNIFTYVSRDQLRLATLATMKFITSKIKSSEHFPNGLVDGSWPAELCGKMCSWAPVQDRYVILVTASSSLVRSQAVEEDFERQYVLATLVAWLLGDLRINFIGLSVMDVLVGLMGRILELLQVGGAASLLNGVDAKASKDSIAAPQESSTPDSSERATTPTDARKMLIQQLKKCVSNLATHIYYTDQIPDMVSAVLSRLKPVGGGVSNTAAAIEDPSGTVESVASSAHLHENPGADNFFSFETARVIALEAIKDILHIANAHGKDVDSGKGSVGRSRTGIDAWEGTQWLLRDPAPKVRRAYADALLVWLELELKKTDLRAVPESFAGKTERKERKEGDSLVRRAVSNATSPGSPRDKSPRRFRTSFLQLLHLAVYENAHQFALANGSEADQEILLLHLLLARLVAKLGVNALCTGLPMMFRLQEDIPNVEGAAAKVRLGSLVHGYFWALSTSFDFAASHPGMAIGSEINRRKETGMWLQSVSMPPVELKDIASAPGLTSLPADTVDHEALKPFDNRQELVDQIAEGYADSVYSPPTSAPGSPSRSFSVSLSIPNITGGGFMDDPRDSQLPKSNVLPQKVRDQMMDSWNKEDVLAAMASNHDASSQSGSLSISHRTKRAHTHSSVATAGDPRSPNGYLGVNIPTGHVSPMPSPSMINHHHRSALSGLNDGGHHHRSGPGSSSSARSAIRLDDLKRVLSEKGGDASSPILPMTRRGRSAEGDDDGDDSDSMVSADFSTSEYSYAAPGSSYSHGTSAGEDGNGGQTRPPLSTIPSSSMGLDDAAAYGAPPVPQIPAAFAGEGTPATTTTPPQSGDASPGAEAQQRPRTATNGGGSRNNSLAAGTGVSANGSAMRASRSVKSRAGQSTKSGRGRSRSRSVVTSSGNRRTDHGRMDVGGLLAGIGVDDDDDDDILGGSGGGAGGGDGLLGGKGGYLGVVNAPY